MNNVKEAVEKEEEQKTLRGRPRKYSYTKISKEKDEELLIAEENLNKHRFFYVCFTYIYMNVSRWGYTFIETQFNKMYSIGDVRRITNIFDAVPVTNIEFKNKKEWLEYQGLDTVEFPFEVLDNFD